MKLPLNLAKASSKVRISPTVENPLRRQDEEEREEEVEEEEAARREVAAAAAVEKEREVDSNLTGFGRRKCVLTSGDGGERGMRGQQSRKRDKRTDQRRMKE